MHLQRNAFSRTNPSGLLSREVGRRAFDVSTAQYEAGTTDYLTVITTQLKSIVGPTNTGRLVYQPPYSQCAVILERWQRMGYFSDAHRARRQDRRARAVEKRRLPWRGPDH